MVQFTKSNTVWFLCIKLQIQFNSKNFIMVYIESITQLWRNVFVIFDMIVDSESYIWTMIWWLIVTVYDMTFILSLKLLCRLYSVCPVCLYFYFILFLPTWWINDIYKFHSSRTARDSATIQPRTIQPRTNEPHSTLPPDNSAPLNIILRHNEHIYSANKHQSQAI